MDWFRFLKCVFNNKDADLRKLHVKIYLQWEPHINLQGAFFVFALYISPHVILFKASVFTLNHGYMVFNFLSNSDVPSVIFRSSIPTKNGPKTGVLQPRLRDTFKFRYIVTHPFRVVYSAKIF